MQENIDKVMERQEGLEALNDKAGKSMFLRPFYSATNI
jgi:hypothetical protein